MNCYYYSLKLGRRGVLDNARRCFIEISWSDLVQSRWEGASRVGPNMAEEISSWLREREPALIAYDVRDTVKTYARRGARLSQLCDQFGDGIIFFLCQGLSADLYV